MAVSFANSRAPRLCVHPFDPLSARCGSHKWIRKVLCFPRNLVVPELHDAHGVGRLTVIRYDQFGDPEITSANDSSDGKPLFARLTSALALYVASTAGIPAPRPRDKCGAPFQNRWHRMPPNADPAPHGSGDLALQNTVPSFVDRSS